LDPDQLAREQRMDEAAVDVEVAWEERAREEARSAGNSIIEDVDRRPFEAAMKPIYDEAMRELAPLARVLGFTSIESYVTWKRLEPRREGEFDFGFYDEVTRVLQEYGLKWFPLLIVGSGYALPDWFLEHPEMAGFMCLEHGRSNSIQSIWHPAQRRHVTRVLQAFGRHYEPMGVLEGVRLGPSGNYGESQYPAGGSWGAKGEKMHIHIGWWAADPEARADFRRWLGARYGRIEELNRAWDADYRDFAAVEPVLSTQRTSGSATRRTRMCSEGDSGDLHHRGALRRCHGQGLRRRVPGGLHLRRRAEPVHPARRMCRLWCLRTGVSGRGDLLRR